jgi:hypothetical protein
MMSGGGGGVGGGHGGFVAAGRANGYPDNWMQETKATLEQELKERGLEPMPQPQKCNCIPHIMITLLVTSLAWLIFWELT